MSNVFAIFKQDLRNLLNNTIAAIVTVGLILVPPMYAWFTTLGFWDPYSNTGNLSVAVANEDEGYRSDLIPMKIQAGDQIVNQLRANSQFNWRFVDGDNAVDGVKSGAYYAAIVIPKTFSKDLMTVFTPDIEHSEIIYYTNEKENAIAPRITDTGATTLQSRIDETFAKTIADVALDLTSNLSSYLSGDNLASYVRALEDRTEEAANSLSEYAKQARLMSQILGTVATLTQSSAKLASDIEAGTEGNEQLLSGASEMISSSSDTLSSAGSILDESISNVLGSVSNIEFALDDVLATMSDDPQTAAKLIGEIRQSMDSAAEDLGRVRVDAALAGAPDAVILAIDDAIGALSNVSGNLGSAADSLQSASSNASSDIADAKDRVSEARKSIGDVQDFYNGNLKGKASELAKTLQAAIGSTSAYVDRMNASIEALTRGSGSVAEDISNVQAALDETANVMDDASQRMLGAVDRLRQAQSSGDMDEVRRIVGSNPEALASFLSAPTELVKHPVYEMPNNGSAMSPFYTSLSLWIGAIFLVALMSPFVSQEARRKLKDPKPWQMYLGRYLIFGMIALMQAIVLFLGNIFFLGVHCEHLWLYLLTCLLTVIVFSNVVYTLTISFGNVGKAVAIILLVLQLAGSGGIFPVQMSAEFFQWIYPYLPFSHSMEAFESAMAGIYGMQYAQSMGDLALLLVPSLALGLFLRRPIIKMNDYVNRKLDETELV